MDVELQVCMDIDWRREQAEKDISYGNLVRLTNVYCVNDGIETRGNQARYGRTRTKYVGSTVTKVSDTRNTGTWNVDC